MIKKLKTLKNGKKKCHNLLILRVKLIEFWVHIKGYGQIYHEESENHGPETEGIILEAPAPKYPKKVKI